MKALARLVEINKEVEEAARNCSKTVREFESSSVKSILNIMETLVAMESLVCRTLEISHEFSAYISMTLNRASTLAAGVRGIPPEKKVKDLCLDDVQRLAGWEVNVSAAVDCLLEVSSALADGYARAIAPADQEEGPQINAGYTLLACGMSQDLDIICGPKTR